MDYIPPNRKIITGLNEKGEQKAMVAYVTALQHWVRNLSQNWGRKPTHAEIQKAFQYI